MEDCRCPVIVILVALLSRAFSSGDSPGPGWVRVGPIEDIRAEEVVSISEANAYVVANPPMTPIALLARSPHLGEQVIYCPTSMWFEDPAHGAKFDRLGNYVLGPASRGLDRLAIVIEEGVVWVNPTEVTVGPPRGSRELTPRAGPFCSGGN